MSSPIAPARLAAFTASLAVASGRLDLSNAVARARASLVDDRDRALAQDIAVGVQRWRGALDYVIGRFARRPIAKLDPEVLEILRLGTYELLHHSRVPAPAIVDDAVGLAARVRKASARGLVNAVLRAIAGSRRETEQLLPQRPADPADRPAALAYLSITLSHPQWLAERWLDRYGFESAEAWLQFNLSPAPLTLRANPFRTTTRALVARLEGEHVAVHRGRYAAEAIIVDRGTPLRGRGIDEGWFVVQDEGSQLLAMLAGVELPARVLDACASPGGKATALAARLPPGGLLVACDVRDRRIELLRRTVAATGAPNIRLVQADLLRPLPFAPVFGCVFVDAPCSGLGTLRRDPDIKWRRCPEDLALFAARQQTMLRRAAAVVRPGGRLVYATCSSEPEENESVAEAFLAASPEFAAVGATEGTGLPPAVVDAAGHLRTAPHLHGLEAFFGAVFRRMGRGTD